MGISTAEARSEFSRRGHTGAVDSIASQMGISTAEASSELNRRAYAGAVDSIANQMGISTAEASSEFMRRGRDGVIASLNARNNRVSDTTLQCFRCYKKDGVQTLRELPVKSTHQKSERSSGRSCTGKSQSISGKLRGM